MCCWPPRGGAASEYLSEPWYLRWSDDPFGVSPECFATGQLVFVQNRKYSKGVIRCGYEQLPPPWWSQRLFLRLGAPRPQLAGKQARATVTLRLPTMVASTVALASAGLATGVWVGAEATVLAA